MMMIIVMTVVLNVVPICGCPSWCQIHSSNCKMDANASNGSPRAGQLINNILARVEELSEVISPFRENSELSSINEEVARSFNRGGRGHDINLQQSTAMSSTGTSFATVSSIEPRQYFPAMKHNKRILNSSSSSRKKQSKMKKGPSGPFIRDIVLLSGPNVNAVPCQSARVNLVENGHIILGFQLMKEWKGYEVEMHVRNAFGDKLKDHNIDIEIVMSVHNTLHPPCLAPNQTLNGFMVHKVFKDKPIYVRPSVQILEPLSNRINKPEHLNDQEDLCIVQVCLSCLPFHFFKYILLEINLRISH